MAFAETLAKFDAGWKGTVSEIDAFFVGLDGTLTKFARVVEGFDQRDAALAAAEQTALAEAGKVIESANHSAFDIVAAAHRDAEAIISSAKSTASAEATRYGADRATRLKELIELDEAIAARRKTIEQLNAELANLSIRLGGAP